MEQDTVIMQDIFLFVQDGIDETGPGVRALHLDRRSSGVYGHGSNRPASDCPPTCSPPGSSDGSSRLSWICLLGIGP